MKDDFKGTTKKLIRVPVNARVLNSDEEVKTLKCKTTTYLVCDTFIFIYVIVILNLHIKCLDTDVSANHVLHELLIWYGLLGCFMFLSIITSFCTLRMIKQRYIKFGASIANLLIDMTLFGLCLYSFHCVNDLWKHHEAHKDEPDHKCVCGNPKKVWIPVIFLSFLIIARTGHVILFLFYTLSYLVCCCVPDSWCIKPSFLT